MKVANAKVRFFIAFGSAFVLAALFIPASGQAHTFSLLYRPPWHEHIQTLAMLFLATITLVSVAPLCLRGTGAHRQLAILVAVLPVYVLVRFLMYMAALLAA